MVLEARHGNAADAEQYWHQLMRQGTVLFEHDDVVGALIHFEQACILARSLAGLWDDSGDALAAVVVSHLSFSDALARACRVEEAAATLCDLHGSLLQAASDASLTPSARQSALQHLRQTTAALARLQLTHGPRRDVQRMLDAAWSGTACAVPATAFGLASAMLH